VLSFTNPIRTSLKLTNLQNAANDIHDRRNRCYRHAPKDCHLVRPLRYLPSSNPNLTTPSVVTENSNPCATTINANANNNKRDPQRLFRAPHLAPRPVYAPDCPGVSTATTTQTVTTLRYVDETITTSLTATPPQSTVYKTTTVTSTSSAPSCPTIAATVSQSGYTSDYVLYSSTCGRTLSYANPGNTNPPVVLAIKTKVLACEAARQCATAARNQGAGYLSFDLHYRFATGWECVMFYGRNRDAKYFEVEEGVGEGYGYSV
jgi:hypothetical protein